MHQNLVAEDRKIIKSGILEIIEGKINAGLQAYLDKKKGKKTDDKKENGKERMVMANHLKVVNQTF